MNFAEARARILSQLDAHAAAGGDYVPEAIDAVLCEDGSSVLLFVMLRDGGHAAACFDLPRRAGPGGFDPDHFTAALFAPATTAAK
jgi:hypothetical protein